MERLTKKFEQRYKKAQDAVAQWRGIQARLERLFANAAAVIQRTPLLMAECNYGNLKEIGGLTSQLPGKQAESLEKIFFAMREALGELEGVCKCLEKLWRDGNNLLRNEKPKPTPQQTRQRIGSRASLEDCVNGLRDLYIMHRDEYSLKVDIVSAVTYDMRSDDVTALQAVLADQPNIPPEEVQYVFDLVSAGAG